MKPAIIKNESTEEFYISEGCFITELSNSDADQGLSIARARVKPGVTTRLHHLEGIVERYLIMSGSGNVEIGALPTESVAPGDVVLIPSKCAQRITNTGNQDLVFLAICTPRFQLDRYQDIEEQRIA